MRSSRQTTSKLRSSLSVGRITDGYRMRATIVVLAAVTGMGANRCTGGEPLGKQTSSKSEWTTSNKVSIGSTPNHNPVWFSTGQHAPTQAAYQITIENGYLIIHGTQLDDRIHVSEAGGVIDVIMITPQGTLSESIVRFNLNETVTGIPAITIYGYQGNDVIINDTDIESVIIGGWGHDRILGGLVHDGIDGGLGADVIFGSSGEDFIGGHHGNDIISGGFPPPGAFTYPGKFNISAFLEDVDGVVWDGEQDSLMEGFFDDQNEIYSDDLCDIYFVETAREGIVSWLVDDILTEDPKDEIR